MRELFTIDERKTSNIQGIKKNKLDEDKLHTYVCTMPFKLKVVRSRKKQSVHNKATDT